MDDNTKSFISWFINKITSTPSKRDKELLKNKLIEAPQEIKLNIIKGLDDLVLSAIIAGVAVDKRKISAELLFLELKKTILAE